MQSLPTINPRRLLKANDIRELGSKVVFNFEDLRERGEAYLETIREQARKLLADTESEAVALREEARSRGRAEGEREGALHAAEAIETRAREIADETARKTLATALPAVRAAADALVVERDRWLQEWERTALRVAAGIAGKIVGRQIDLEPDLARTTIRNALQLAAGSPRISVRLNPDDAARLGPSADELVRAMAACGTAEVIADQTLAPGSCVIQTAHGTIDARVETILDRIVGELLDEIN